VWVCSWHWTHCTLQACSFCALCCQWFHHSQNINLKLTCTQNCSHLIKIIEIKKYKCVTSQPKLLTASWQCLMSEDRDIPLFPRQWTVCSFCQLRHVNYWGTRLYHYSRKYSGIHYTNKTLLIVYRQVLLILMCCSRKRDNNSNNTRKPSCRWQTRAMLEIQVTGHSRASKVTPFDSLPMVSYYHPIGTLCLECTVFEILLHIGRKSPKNLPHPHLTPPPSFDAPSPANHQEYPHKPYFSRNCDLWPTSCKKKHSFICNDRERCL